MTPTEHTTHATLASKDAQGRAVDLLNLCAGPLPARRRHMSTSRAQSKVAVTQMLQAFADIRLHINMAKRQLAQISDALAQPVEAIVGLVDACEHALLPLIQDPLLSLQHRSAVGSALVFVRRAVGALEQISKPFQHESQMVAVQLERMYMGFQYQDRISQMLNLSEMDVAYLQSVMTDRDATVLGLEYCLQCLEFQYAMVVQVHDYTSIGNGDTLADNSKTTFF